MHEGVFATLGETCGPAEGLDRAPRFPEPIAHVWLEPELSRRDHRADARAVLDELAVTLEQGQRPPALPEDPVCDLHIEDLSRPTTAHARACFCLSADDLRPDPGHPAPRGASRAVSR